MVEKRKNSTRIEHIAFKELQETDHRAELSDLNRNSTNCIRNHSTTY